jgi:HSP20 family protein
MYGDDLWPFPEFERLRSQINQLFDEDSRTGSTGLFDRSTAPRLDVMETDDAIMIACDIPGVEAKDIELDVVNNVLSLRGEKKRNGKETDSYVQRETWYGSFQRTLALPDSIDPDNVSAELTNGVLSIHIAKREEHKPKRIGVKVK